MTHGSLFSGIGGIDLGFEWAGIETRWQVEIDDYCQKLLSLRFPHTKKFTDVRKVGSHNLEKVDIISGGFPCQDISVAGKGAGIEGERSGLWTELHRVISELRPRFAFIENVPMLTIRGEHELLLILPKSGMMRNGKLWEQTTLVLGTEGNGSGLWPTPTGTERSGTNPKTGRGEGLSKVVKMTLKDTHSIPTPTASDHIKRESTSTEKLNFATNKTVSLDRWVEKFPDQKTTDKMRQQMFPTPSANEDAAGTPKGKMQRMLGNCEEVRNTGTGTLNPTWVEWLMGFPSGWTDLKDSETP